MKTKKVYSAKQARQKKREMIFFGILIGLVAVVIVLAIVQAIVGEEPSGYVVTEDGHVHAADGTHISTLEEMLADENSGLTVTEDGHIHSAAGEHLGTLNTAGSTTESGAAEAGTTTAETETPAAE